MLSHVERRGGMWRDVEGCGRFEGGFVKGALEPKWLLKDTFKLQVGT